MTSRDILQAALLLPAAEREQLVEEIAASLDVTVDDEFLAVLKKRQDDFHRGVPGVPADEVFARLLKR